MEGIIPWFGALIQNLCPRNPELARRLLRLGYHAKNLQLKAAPGKLNRAAPADGDRDHYLHCPPPGPPDRAAMVSLFTPCEMLQVLGLYPYSCEGLGCFLAGPGPSGLFWNMPRTRDCRRPSAPTTKFSSEPPSGA